ncbi:MAG: hypothetical protein GOMPHAMPRED_007916 [Gomphillus americanus]|uniref:ABC transporter domain-containing protein n=1 Tax=Gomphillus americanus TaxID=1940652 RepID=A0A8H3F022_9LECA|nr:MAG: hypothetical protein GOMPHAMPRED_007916 [Gomphillus americanus]
MGGKIVTSIQKPPIVRLSNATFFRKHIESGSSIGSNPPLFPGINLEIWPSHLGAEYWAIIGPAGSGKTTLLEILKGNYFCEPPLSRSYPYLPRVVARKTIDRRVLRNRDVHKAIRYAGFGGKGTNLAGVETRGSYMAARYESRHEAQDFSLKDYLLGNTGLNPADNQKGLLAERIDERRLAKISKSLQLDHLLDQPALVLSNGQTRRARIAKAYMEFPLLLLLDEPFLGIDPVHHRILAPALWALSRRSGPSIVITMNNEEVPPRWVTHLMCLENLQVRFSGPKDVVYKEALAAGYPLATTRLKRTLWRGSGELEEDEVDTTDDLEPDVSDANSDQPSIAADTDTTGFANRDQPEQQQTDIAAEEDKSNSLITRMPSFKNRWSAQDDVIASLEIGDPVIEMKGVQVNYGNLVALGDWHQPEQETTGLHWTIRRGERWGIFGPNGSGKTTVLSLVNSDHPKSYSQSILYFERSRLPEVGQPGIPIFDLQSRIMQASPEVHAFFPKNLSVRAVLENAWADTFLSKPRLTYEIDSKVEAVLRWFEKELNPHCTDEDPLAALSEWPYTARRKAQNRVSIFYERGLDWADTIHLSELSFGAQRVALFLRAIIKKPDLVILDEAFSGMDKNTRIKCMMFLAYGETKWLAPKRQSKSNDMSEVDLLAKFQTPLVETGAVKNHPFESRQALVVVAHEPDEVPPLVDRYMFLEEPGSKKPPRFGMIPPGKERDSTRRRHWWGKLWDPSIAATNKDTFNRSYGHKIGQQ